MPQTSPSSALARIKRGASSAIAIIGTGVARRERPDSLGPVLSAFESETQDVFLRTTPRSDHTVLYALGVMFLLTFVMMVLLKLDVVVTGTGKILPRQGQIYVQAFNNAIVKDLKVRVGEVVRKGQVLATLDPTFVDANLATVAKKLASDRAQEDRDAAEIADAAYQPKDKDSYGAMQLALWQQRQSEYKSNIANYDAQISNSQATIRQLQSDVREFSERLKLASQHETMDRTLEQKGWGSALLTLSSTDQRVEIERQLNDSRNQLVADQQSAQALIAQRAAYTQKWHSDASTDLVNTRAAVDKDVEDLKSAQLMKQLASIVSPQDAVVVQIGRASPGAVTMPTDTSQSLNVPLFTLVPLRGNLEADVSISTQDQGFVRPGQQVTIKLDAFEYIRYGTVSGVVKSVSDSSFNVDQNTNQPVAPYVTARIAITGLQNLHDVGSHFRLVPGMTLEADVKVTRRSLFSYLTESMVRTVDESMREP